MFKIFEKIRQWCRPEPWVMSPTLQALLDAKEPGERLVPFTDQVEKHGWDEVLSRSDSRRGWVVTLSSTWNQDLIGSHKPGEVVRMELICNGFCIRSADVVPWPQARVEARFWLAEEASAR